MPSPGDSVIIPAIEIPADQLADLAGLHRTHGFCLEAREGPARAFAHMDGNPIDLVTRLIQLARIGHAAVQASTFQPHGALGQLVREAAVNLEREAHS